MKTCLIIPCYNHANKLQELIDSSSGLPVIVVDDGSNPPIEAKNCKILRLNKNSGKATALSNGFAEAERMGFDHAITIDADGQHDPIAIPQFISASQKFPDAIGVGAGNVCRFARANDGPCPSRQTCDFACKVCSTVLLPAPVGSADSQQSLSVLPNFVYIYSIKFPRAKTAFMDIFSSKTTKSASIL